MWYLHKDQWNRTEGPETFPHIYRQLIFDKDKRQFSLPTNGTEKLDIHMQKVNFHP